MCVKMPPSVWSKFWFLFFLDFFKICKFVFLLSLLQQVNQNSPELFLSQHPCCVNTSCSCEHYFNSSIHNWPPDPVPLFSSEHCSNTSPPDPLNLSSLQSACAPQYSRDELLFLRGNVTPLDPTLDATLFELGIKQRVKARRSRAGGRRKQRKIPVLALGSGITVRTPDTVRADCWPPSSDEGVATPSSHHGSGDVNGSTSPDVIASGSASPTSPVLGPVPLSPVFSAMDTESASLPFADVSLNSTVSSGTLVVPTSSGVSGFVSDTPRGRQPANLVDIKSSSRDRLSVCVFNAQSVGKKSKRIDIVEFIRDENVDIMFLTETWLKTHGDESKHADLTPAGYCLKSLPRATRAGGVAVLVREHFPVVITTSFSFAHDSFEVIQLTLNTPVCVHFFCVYRPPPSKANKLTDAMFYAEFSDMLAALQGNVVIVGDFNFHYDKPDSYSTVRMVDILSTFGLKQAVSEPTHRSGHIIDWVLFRPDDNVFRSCYVSQNLTSDHFAVLCDLDVRRPTRQPEYRKVRNLRAIDMTVFRHDVAALAAASSTPSADQLCDQLRSILDDHAPAAQRKVPQRRSTPWYNAVASELRALKQDKRHAERQWLCSDLAIHKQIFCSFKHKINRLVDKAKTAYFNAKISASTTCRQLFSITNTLMNKTRCTALPSSPVSLLPQRFCDFFVSKVSDIRSNIDMSASAGAPVSDPVSFSGTPLLQFSPVEPSVVLKTIRSMTPTSCDLDPVPTPLLLECIDDILPVLTQMINDCFQSGTVPSVFKQAIVKPLLKKQDLDPNKPSNYRPVSNLSFLSKLLEKLALQQMLEHVSKYDLFARFQSAYRAHHSTETALLRVLNDLLVASDDSKVSILTLLDLSAAFDTIDHGILLTRLRHVFGIDNVALSFLQSYLSDRRQTVLIQGFVSESTPLKYGVPQGSVLGPLLFLLYTQPLPHVIDNHSVSHSEFADDTQLYNSSHPSQIQTLLSTSEHCISDVKQWMTQNKLQLNDSKTEALLVGGKGASDQALKLTIGHSEITFSKSVRNLGVMFDDELSMRVHVNKVCQLAYYELRKISTIRHYLSQQATETLVTSLVLSRLDYGNSLLAGIPDTLLNKLQKVQNSAARLVFRCPKRTHTTPLLRALHWLPIAQRIDYKLSSMCYNFFNQTAPHALTEILTVYTPSRSLRSSADTKMLKVPRRDKKTQGQRSFSYIGPVTWNSLPLSVRDSDTPTQFKSSLKTHLFRSAFSADQ